MSTIQPGASRTTVESMLGFPVRSWISSTGVLWCVYQFDLGTAPSTADAVLLAWGDLWLVGLPELLDFLSNGKLTEKPHRIERVLISYDRNGTVLGLFDEYAALPPDGRSTARPAILMQP